MTRGEDIAALAASRLGEAYVLGARARYTDPDYHGPWDCAELATWAAYQATGLLVGVNADGEAYSGAWAIEPRALVPIVPDLYTPGAVLVRAPSGPGASGHVAIVETREGGTVEAYDTAHGVIRSNAVGRRWSRVVRLAGVTYTRPSGVPVGPRVAPPRVVRYAERSPDVTAIQAALVTAGFDPGSIDGRFGRRTLAAVIAFQRSRGLVPDGEVGPLTAAALGISW